MRHFLKGKRMWGYINETYVIPKNTEEGDDVSIDTWKANNAKIITWINDFVKYSIGTHWQSMRQQKRFGIICKGYSRSQILLNNIN
jgi:hypothetical protein